MDHVYRESKLKEYIEARITVTAVYDNCVFDSDKHVEYVLLTDVRHINGNVVRNHIWSQETDVFKNCEHIEKGSIIQFEGTVSKYRKGIDSNIEDYTLSDISNLKIMGNRLSNQEMCFSCNYKINAKEIEQKINDYKNRLNQRSDNDLEALRNEKELKKKIKELEEKIEKSTEKYQNSNRIKNSLRSKNRHLTELFEELYEISQRKTVTDIDRFKKRISVMIGDTVKCSECNRKLNKCIC